MRRGRTSVSLSIMLIGLGLIILWAQVLNEVTALHFVKGLTGIFLIIAGIKLLLDYKLENIREEERLCVKEE